MKSFRTPSKDKVETGRTAGLRVDTPNKGPNHAEGAKGSEMQIIVLYDTIRTIIRGDTGIAIVSNIRVDILVLMNWQPARK